MATLLKFLVLVVVLVSCRAVDRPRAVLVEAEAFREHGGWVNDQQFMDLMGSPYLLAHGMGRPVDNAKTVVETGGAGTYRVWVRTRDWVAPWGVAGAPSSSATRSRSSSATSQASKGAVMRSC